MTKEECRQKVFDKYNGKCAYCGDPLQKGWHVDEILPVIRKKKLLPAGFYHKVTKKIKPKGHRAMTDPDYEFFSQRWVPDGVKHPERFNLENQMPSCPSCNINKHSDSLEQFRQHIQHFIISLNRDSTQYKIAKRYGLITETGKKVIFYFETFIK